MWSMFCNVKLFIIVLLLLMSKSLIKMLLWYRINKWSLLLMTCLDKPCYSLRDVGVNAWYNTRKQLGSKFDFLLHANYQIISNDTRHPSNNTSHSVVVVPTPHSILAEIREQLRNPTHHPFNPIHHQSIFSQSSCRDAVLLLGDGKKWLRLYAN